MARVIMGGGGGDQNYPGGDYEGMDDMSRDRSSLRPKPSYISKFASKVREDIKNRKVCWSSMGLPSILPPINPSKPRQSTPNFLAHCNQHFGTNALTFGSKRASLSSIKSKPSSHTSLPYKHSRTLRLVPCPPMPQKVSKWDSYYKLKPSLVRPRKQVEFEDIDFDMMRGQMEEDERDYSSGDQRTEPTNEQSHSNLHESCIPSYLPPRQLAVEMNPKTAMNPLPKESKNLNNSGGLKMSQNQFQMSRDNPMVLHAEDYEKEEEHPPTQKEVPVTLKAEDMEKAICSCHSAFKSLNTRNTQGSSPGVLNPCICSRAYEMVKNNPESIDLSNCSSPEDLQKKLSSITTDQALCDAFILQKLLEIRSRMGQKTEEKDTVGPSSDEQNGDGLPSTCYHGEVNIIDRGQKDFILENAIKCSRMQPGKRGPRGTTEDWKGNASQLGQRMVFKKDFGQVPDYILKRKAEIQTEKELLERFETEEANKKCRALSDEERKALIEGLSQNWEKLFLEFQNLPLFSSSQRVLKRKSEIETQLRDLESDLRLITRHGRLFVANNVAPSVNSFLWS